MRTAYLGCSLLAALLFAAAVDAGEPARIRLARPVEPGSADAEQTPATLGGPRRGFDYEAFEARFESLWFQRKALLAEGREADVAEQSRRIRAFCTEEGVQRLEHIASALIVEAQRGQRQGRYRAALDALELAASFDADRAEIHFAVAQTLWRMGGNRADAALSLGRGLRAGSLAALRELSLPPRVALVVVVALIACLVIFATLMMVRYQRAFRHEIEEWVAHVLHHRWAPAAGWAGLMLPLVCWVGAGWLALYWLVAMFRFMTRVERLACTALLVLLAMTFPVYGAAVALYGATADPMVRTTLAAAGGEYSPDRIVRVRQLTDARPDNPVYHFLLAGLYKGGRYFEEAFDEYQRALALDPALAAAHVNLGNMFYATGQYGEAIANYHRALQADPTSLLALFNLHLAQSEAFRFAEAEHSLERARTLDSAALARLFAESRRGTERASVVDASLTIGSVWNAALGSEGIAAAAKDPAPSPAEPANRLRDPLFVGAAVGLLACLLSFGWTLRHPAARCCVRCGRAFCQLCKSGREGQEYCTACTYAFVLGDGLAADAKRVRLFAAERHAQLRRIGRRVASLLLPGTGQLLGGQTVRGLALLLPWVGAWSVAYPAWLEPLERVTGLRIGLELVDPPGVPQAFALDPLTVAACLLLLASWLLANVPRSRLQEA